MNVERKKRMMPRHLLAAAVLIGVIPHNIIPKQDLISIEELKRLNERMSPKPIRARSQDTGVIPNRGRVRPPKANNI